MELGLEQKFAIASFASKVDQMSPEQLRETLKLLHEAYVVQRVTYLELLKQEWNIGVIN